MKLRQKLMRKFVNFYLPFIGAGIRVKINDDEKKIYVKMKLTFYNKNYVRTHFGGSLYSMCDPFFMLLLMDYLGNDYYVWDKSAGISFQNPGKGTVYAEFFIPEKKYLDIKQEAEKGDVVFPKFSVDVIDDEGTIIATVEKSLYVKKKK